MSGFLNDLGLDNVEADPNYINDGKYLAYVFSSEIRETRKGKSWVLTYKIAPEAAKHSGQTQQEWFDLEPQGDKAEMQKSFLKRRVLSLGVPESKIDVVNPADVIGTKVSMTIIHRNGYQNVGNIELADGSVPATGATASAIGGAL